MNIFQPAAILGLMFALQGCQTPQTIIPIRSDAQIEQPKKVPTANRLRGSIEGTQFVGLIRKGVANAPSTAAASAVLAAAGSRVTTAQSTFQPQLTAEGSINSDGDTVPVLRLSQIIYDGGRTKKQVELRRTEIEQVYESEVANLSARAFEAVEAVINLDRDQRLQAQAQRNVSRVRGFVVDLEDRFDAGAGSVADVLTGKGRLSNAQAEVDQAVLDVTYAKAAWVEAFGVQASAVPSIPTAPLLKSIGAEEVLIRSPRLREAEFTTTLREQELELARTSGRPVISAIIESDFGNDSQARLGVSVPIYKGGRQKSEIATATSHLAESKERSSVLRRQLSRALTQAMAETSSNAARVSRARQAVNLNKQSLDAAQGQFRLGKGSLLQTLEALRELNEAQVRLIKQDAEAKRAEYAILAVTGDILDALGIISPARPAQAN
jgi:adhesin transport system outer membrane protein